MINNVKQYYKDLLKKNGPTLAAVQHNSREAQNKRFEILFNIDKGMKSLIDVGCGLGDFGDFLLKKKYYGKYLGLDFVEEFIQIAKEKFIDKSNFKFQTFELQNEHIPTGYDYILLSGVFNNNTENSKRFMFDLIKKMLRSCNKGVAFNSMSTYVEFQEDELFYSDPKEIFHYCKKHLTQSVVLKHDYKLKEDAFPYEYTMYLYKDFP